jgi:hypothetical protein
MRAFLDFLDFPSAFFVGAADYETPAAPSLVFAGLIHLLIVDAAWFKRGKFVISLLFFRE